MRIFWLLVIFVIGIFSQPLKRILQTTSCPENTVPAFRIYVIDGASDATKQNCEFSISIAIGNCTLITQNISNSASPYVCFNAKSQICPAENATFFGGYTTAYCQGKKYTENFYPVTKFAINQEFIAYSPLMQSVMALGVGCINPFGNDQEAAIWKPRSCTSNLPFIEKNAGYYTTPSIFISIFIFVMIFYLL